MAAVLPFASMVTATDTHLSADDTLRERLAHPAFAGLAVCCCRGTTGLMTTGCRFETSAHCSPYHSHVDPATVVSALNDMISDVKRTHHGPANQSPLRHGH